MPVGKQRFLLSVSWLCVSGTAGRGGSFNQDLGTDERTGKRRLRAIGGRFHHILIRTEPGSEVEQKQGEAARRIWS